VVINLTVEGYNSLCDSAPDPQSADSQATAQRQTARRCFLTSTEEHPLAGKTGAGHGFVLLVILSQQHHKRRLHPRINNSSYGFQTEQAE